MNNQETIDIAWDAARRQYKQNTQNPANQSIHAICGQSIELVLKASVASRTLDNITGVLISFKNFRKTLKNEAASERPPA
jgi:superoxide dismutase